MRFLSVNIGFITNSSSCVFHFPVEVWNDPKVQAWVKAHELQGGYIGENLWYRSECSSLLITKEQKQSAIMQGLEESKEWSDDLDTLGIQADSDDIVIIYGDEYQDATHLLCNIMSEAAKRLGVTVTSMDYN